MVINFTLIIGFVLLILGIKAGYSTGFAKGIANLIALLVTMVVLALIMMLTTSFKAGETRNVIFTIIIMAILGAVYSIVKFLLRSFKAISNLPIIQFADKVFGIVIGIVWVFALYMCLITLGMKGYLGELSEVIRDDVEGNLFLTILCGCNIFL